MVCIIIRGSVILIVSQIGRQLKNVKYLSYKYTKQTVSEKVNSQKGNSPNRRLKFQNITKEKTAYYLV